jgi:hypothetical protein
MNDTPKTTHIDRLITDRHSFDDRSEFISHAASDGSSMIEMAVSDGSSVIEMAGRTGSTNTVCGSVQMPNDQPNSTDEEIVERILAAEPDEYDECRDWIPVLAKAYAAGRAEERERCATIARNGANFFRDKPIKFVTPEKYAADLADDIADAIESGAPP